MSLVVFLKKLFGVVALQCVFLFSRCCMVVCLLMFDGWLLCVCCCLWFVYCLRMWFIAVACCVLFVVVVGCWLFVFV